jgi:OmpA-OmpF porin, OOP family
MKTICTIKTKHRAALMVAAIILLLPFSVRSEIREGTFELSPFLGYNLFEDRQNLEDDFVFGGRFGYTLTNNFGLEGAWEYMSTGVDDKAENYSRQGEFTSPIDSVKINMYHLDLLYHFMPEGDFNPFIVAGYGAANYRPEKINHNDMSLISFGLGTKYWIADNFAFRLDLRDNMILDEAIHNFEATVGIVFAGGGETKVATKATPRPKEDAPVVVLMSEPKAEEKVKQVAAVPATPKVVVLAFEDVHFNFDQSTLTPEAREILKRNIAILKANPNVKIRIAGYTSASGTEEYNQRLSERRAKAVYDYVTKEGLVSSKNLTTIGYGEKSPAEHEPTPTDLYSPKAKANMRVLFQIDVK